MLPLDCFVAPLLGGRCRERLRIEMIGTKATGAGWVLRLGPGMVGAALMRISPALSSTHQIVPVLHFPISRKARHKINTLSCDRGPRAGGKSMTQKRVPFGGGAVPRMRAPISSIFSPIGISIGMRSLDRMERDGLALVAKSSDQHFGDAVRVMAGDDAADGWWLGVSHFFLLTSNYLTLSPRKTGKLSISQLNGLLPLQVVRSQNL